jgi:hypothetical protein
MLVTRMANRWRFTTTADLVRWAEDEYLSELTLADVMPKPGKKAPPKVSFTWWLHAGSTRVPYKLEATGVSEWSLDGKRDEELAIGWFLVDGPGVAFAMQVPGTLTLRCEKVTATRGRKVKAAFERRPLADYTYFHTYGDRTVSQADVLAALGIVGGKIKKHARYGCEVTVGDRRAIEISVYEEPKGHHFNVIRRDATDDEWARAIELPKHLGPSRVAAAWEFEGSDRQWLQTVIRPASARAQPSPSRAAGRGARRTPSY